MQTRIMKNKIFLSIFLAFLFIGCGQEATSGSAASDAQVSSFEDIYTAAEEALAAAEDRRNAWSMTEGMLSDAKIAFDNGQVAEAVELATEAKLQAELALAQAESEKSAWRTRVLTE